MPVEARKGIRSSGIGVPGGCELPCGCREMNVGPIEELHVFLTNELSLQALSLKCIQSACIQYFSFLYPYTLADILPLKLYLVLPVPCSKIPNFLSAQK